MKSGYFSRESLESFQKKVLSEGGVTSFSESPGDLFLSSALNTGATVEFPVADDIGSVRGEYVDNYDYTRCQRPNGTFYGTAGQCRLGSEAGPRQESKVTRETYSWGSIVKVANDPRSQSLILHPEDQDQVMKLRDGEKAMFTDEQGNRITATREGKNIVMKTKESKEEFVVSRDSISGNKEVKRRSIPDQQLADMDGKSLAKLRKSYQKVLSGTGPRLSEEQTKFLKSELTRIKDFDDILKLNKAIRGANEERSKKRDLLKFRIKELQEKMDDAVTIREQQRLSSAISDANKRLQSDELKNRYELSPEERSRALST